MVAPPREWISNATSRLQHYSTVTYTDSATMWMNVVLCADSAVQRNDFELIPTVKMESRHPVEGPIGREFSSIYIVREL